MYDNMMYEEVDMNVENEKDKVVEEEEAPRRRWNKKQEAEEEGRKLNKRGRKSIYGGIMTHTDEPLFDYIAKDEGHYSPFM